MILLLLKKELLGSDCDFQLESDKNNTLEFIHKDRPSVKAVIRERYILFSAGFDSSWSIIHATMVVMEMSSYKLQRYDFQDGRWC